MSIRCVPATTIVTREIVTLAIIGQWARAVTGETSLGLVAVTVDRPTHADFLTPPDPSPRSWRCPGAYSGSSPGKP
jgi:hypothetical protein